jgi:Flp pilus assembly protein TadG
MIDLYLGIIAFAVAIMAIIQVAAVVMAARAVRRVDQLADRLEQDLSPILTNLQALTAEAARASALAAAQVERADRLFTDIAARVDQVLAAVQETLIEPAREGFAWLNGLKAALAAFRELREASRRPSPAAGEDDALFIG